MYLLFEINTYLMLGLCYIYTIPFNSENRGINDL